MVRPYFTDPSARTSPCVERGAGPSSLSERSNAASRASRGALMMLRNIVALTGIFASSATAGATPSTATAATIASTSRLLVMPALPRSLIDDQGIEREVLELFSPVEEGLLDQEGHANDVTAELFDQAQRRGHRS